MKVHAVHGCLGVLAGFVAACAPAQAPQSPVVQGEPSRSFFDTRTAERFGDPTPALGTYLSRTPHGAGPQRFCVIGYRFPDGDTQVWVHWQEGRRLILWDGSDPDYPADLLGWGRRDLSLDTNVVATEADIKGSTYLVTRAWADGVIADCAKGGARYTVAPPRKG